MPLFALVLTTSCAREAVRGTSTADELAVDPRPALMDAGHPAYVAGGETAMRLWTVTQQIYRARAFQPIWLDGKSPAARVEPFLGAVRAAAADGLDVSGLALGESTMRRVTVVWPPRDRAGAADAGAVDVWLTYLYLTVARALAEGPAAFADHDPGWRIRRPALDLRGHFERAVRENRLAESLADLSPHDPEYVALRRTLADYRARASTGNWVTVPADLKLEPGHTSAAVPALARRLAASGDYAGPLPTPDRPAEYGGDLVAAVRKFQRRHGLDEDGVVASRVVAELNVPIDARIRQIRLNMERWRAFPHDLGERHILVNIAEMRLEVRERGSVPLSMRVVVGRKDMPTPVFANRMTYVVFSPYWNVPTQIARDETLPSALADPGFLGRSNMEVIDRSGRAVDPAEIDVERPGTYRFRQRPGRGNSLGLVKFMFPNEFNVYLHDTPSASLFTRVNRSLSHGCVRLEQPAALAEYVLGGDPDWTPERIRAAMYAGTERTVRLREPIPVYLGYWTARVDRSGDVQFRNDVYGLDARQLARLDANLARERDMVGAATAGDGARRSAASYRATLRP